MNYHSDKWIMDKVGQHYAKAIEHFPEDRVVGIFAQGSMNYGLDYEGSDVDTKLVVVPTFEDTVFNRKAISTTYILENDEHIDFKDLRLMLATFRKQNLNFVEILFTPYKILNSKYEEYWNLLIAENEKIAHYNPYSAVKTMKGIAMEKFHAMEHEYPSKVAVLEKFGYDPKQLHHLFRVEEYLERYINGDSYADCLLSKKSAWLKDVKTGLYTLDEARILGKQSLDHIVSMETEFCSQNKSSTNQEVDELLDKTQWNIMYDAMSSYFLKGRE